MAKVPTNPSAQHKVRTVTPRKVGKTSVVQATTTSARHAEVEVFSRKKLVGKFPDIRHLPAPVARRRLTDEERRKLLEGMVLA